MIGYDNEKTPKEKIEKIIPLGSIERHSRSFNLTKILEADEVSFGKFIKTGEYIEEISKVFSSSMPQELAKFPTYTVNDFFMITDKEIVLLLYKNSSSLNYYKFESNFKLETNLSEDALQNLSVDLRREIIIVGCGLFETRIFINELKTFNPITVLDLNSCVEAFEVNPSHGFLISASQNGEVKMWDLDNLGQFSIVSNENYQLISICETFGWVALATNYGRILYTADFKYEIKEPMRVKQIKVSSSGRFLAVNLKSKLHIYNCENSAIVKVIEKNYSSNIKDLKYDSNVLVIALVDGTIIVWQHEISRLPIHLFVKKLKTIRVDNSGYVYASVSPSNIFKVRFPHLPMMYECISTSVTTFSEDSEIFYYGVKRILHGIYLKTGERTIFFSYDYDISRVQAISTDLLMVASKAFFNLFSISQVKNQTLINDEGDYINSIVVDKANFKIYAAGLAMKIRVFSIDPFQELRSFALHTSLITTLIFLSNSCQIVSKTQDGIFFWSTDSQQEEFAIKEEKMILSVSISKNEKFAMISRKDFSITIFDLEKQTVLSGISFEKSFCYGAYLMKNSDFLITVHTDSTIKFWDFSTLTCMFTVKTQGEILYLKVSEDERFLAYKVNLKSINFYVIENPLMAEAISVYGPDQGLSDFYSIFLELKERKQPIYNAKLENFVVVPYMLSMLHLYAYHGLTGHIKSALNAGAGLNKDLSGASPLEIVLKLNHKNSALTFLKYFIKNTGQNPLIGNCITLENLISLNSLGFSVLQDFYDALLCSNSFANLPTSCSKYAFLPKFHIHSDQIAKKTWFFSEDYSETGVAIEFLSSAVSLNFVSGSDESISFLKSLISCPYQDIFRSKLIQYYIDDKWRILRPYVNIECAIYIVYLTLLNVISVDLRNTAVKVLFFVFGFFLSFFEFLQIFGGISEYFKGVWNYVDITRTVFLIIFATEIESIQGNYSSILLILSLVSWTRGISYFRIVSKTRYMINLITEVLKDIFPFLVISAYSTIGFGFILMLMDYNNNDFFSYFTLSYLINLGSINTPDYNSIQWACFIIATIINPIVMMNLIIAIMGDTHDKVQESREVADYKEQAYMILELEIPAVWRRTAKSRQRLHICKEIDTKGISKNWLGKVREIKNMIGSLRQSQVKILDTNSQILKDNLSIKEQINRVEKVILGIKEKIVDKNETSIGDMTCNNGHKLVYDCFFEMGISCFKCKKNCENGQFCPICCFALCQSCYKVAYKEKVGKIDITCYRSHKLAWTSDHSAYEGYGKIVFNCVGCKKMMYKDSYNCRVCKWDICFKCVDIVCNNISTAWSHQCAKGHGVVWDPRPHSSTYSCNSCSQVFTKSGSFRCNICDYDICIRCLDSIPT